MTTIKESSQNRIVLIFKNSEYVNRRGATGNRVTKNYLSKSLKQIIAVERSISWPEDAVYYSLINTPPSFKPVKKYSDVSGLLAPYTDPRTKLQYHNVDEYITVKSLPMDLTSGYLALRRANNIVS